MPDDEFAFFRLIGPRFEAPGLPVAAMGELVTYREVILDVARRLWLTDHPERRRVPRGFPGSLDLRVGEVVAGSVRPLVVRHTDDDYLVEVDGYFEAAREAVTSAIASVESGDGIPPGFPRESVPKLSRMGRGLLGAERVEFGHPTKRSVRSSLTRSTYNMLRAIDEALTSIRLSTRLVGRVVEMDTDASTFELRDSEERRVVCAYDLGLADALRAALDVDGDGPLVEVEGLAVVDADGAVQRFPEPVALFFPEEATAAIIAKLAQLRETPVGWLGEGSKSLDPEVAQTLDGLVGNIARLYPRVGMALMPEGGVRIEWQRPGIDAVLELAPGERAFFFVQGDNVLNSDREIEAEFTNHDHETIAHILSWGEQIWMT